LRLKKLSETDILTEKIKEIQVDIAQIQRRRIKAALWSGDLERAEDLMLDMQRRELCQAYLDKMNSEEVDLQEV